MDLKRTKRLLDKINALHTSIGLDNHVNSIERDLMLSYVRQFYDACLDGNTTVIAPLEEKPAPKPKVKKATTPPPPPPKKEVVEVAPPPPVVETPPPPPPTPKPAPTPPPAPQPAPAPAARKADLAPGIAALFQHQAAKELSEKLSQQRITDLTKAMSINDKLLYANELFGRDMSKMTNVLQEVNSLSDMGAAQDMLGQIATANDWGNDERAEIARSFIKLIRRKFG